MIRANELRIGNTVNRLGSPTEITSIQHTDDIDYVSTPASGAITVNQIEPIPLTKEWLEKMGFERWKQDDDSYSIEDSQGQSIMVRGQECAVYGSDACTSGHSFNFKIEYVHQLQNLYFVLTGNELSVGTK